MYKIAKVVSYCMIYNNVLNGSKIKLRMVKLSDCNSSYCNWLNDIEINQYLETRWSIQTIESIKEFVKSIEESSHSYLFAIIYENKHVGNIKIGPIQPIHKYADISYFIGEKSAWGKGITTEAISLICDFAFNILKLNKLCAGVYENNISSSKVLLKNKFIQEGIKRKQYLSDNSSSDGASGVERYTNVLMYGLLASEYQKE